MTDDDFSLDEEMLLAELDEEVDPLPEEWVYDWIETWRAYEHGGPKIFNLERWPEEVWIRKYRHTKARGERLKDMNAPAIVLANNEKLLAYATAGVCWQRYQRLCRVLDIDTEYER